MTQSPSNPEETDDRLSRILDHASGKKLTRALALHAALSRVSEEMNSPTFVITESDLFVRSGLSASQQAAAAAVLEESGLVRVKAIQPSDRSMPGDRTRYTIMEGESERVDMAAPADEAVEAEQTREEKECEKALRE